MSGKTEEVRDLVDEVLRTFDQPYAENITEEVFVAIEADSNLLKRYQDFVQVSGKSTVNQAIGKATKDITGMKVKQPDVPATRTTLTKTYTKLQS
jgi:hypothetical protein